MKPKENEIQLITNIPRELHSKIKIQAAIKGITMKQFVIDCCKKEMEEDV